MSSHIESKIVIKGWQKVLANKLYDLQPNLVELHLLNQIRSFMKCIHCNQEFCFLRGNCMFYNYKKLDIIEFDEFKLQILTHARGHNKYYKTVYTLFPTKKPTHFAVNHCYTNKHHISDGIKVAKFHSDMVARYIKLQNDNYTRIIKDHQENIYRDLHYCLDENDNYNAYRQIRNKLLKRYK